jgi:hypothetical protein
VQSLLSNVLSARVVDDGDETRGFEDIAAEFNMLG